MKDLEIFIEKDSKILSNYLILRNNKENRLNKWSMKSKHQPKDLKTEIIEYRWECICMFNIWKMIQQLFVQSFPIQKPFSSKN